MEQEDLFADSGLPAGAVQLKQLNGLMVDALDMADAIEELEMQLSAARKRLHLMRTVTIPDRMAELGLRSFSDEHGNQLKIELMVEGKLPKDPERRRSAIKWIEEHDGGSLLKTQVVADFPKGDKERADVLAAELDNKGYQFSVSEDIHHQTLLAYVRERLRNGQEIDEKTIGVHVGPIAKFKKAKK